MSLTVDESIPVVFVKETTDNLDNINIETDLIFDVSGQYCCIWENIGCCMVPQNNWENIIEVNNFFNIKYKKFKPDC